MLFLEVKEIPSLHTIALTGAALAMSLIAIREFAIIENAGFRTIKNAGIRMTCLLQFAEQIVGMGIVRDEELNIMRFIWSKVRKLLHFVYDIPSPVQDLFIKTMLRPREEWYATSTFILKWRILGDRTKVIKSLKHVIATSSQSQVIDFKEIIRFVQTDTQILEPALGLQNVLSQLGSS